MKAIVQDRYGPPEQLRLRIVDRPAAGADEVLVRVRAASLHPDVWHVVRGRPRVLRVMGAGLRRPKQTIPGTDVAGVVEAVGQGVTRFQPGEEVFGESLKGYSWRNGGAYAEYVAAPEEALARKPARLTFEQAAALPTSGFIVLTNLRGHEIRPGQRVLVNGAGGGVGSLAVQLAKARGAEVTAVDRPAKLKMLRELGADEVIDCTREDFTANARRYALIVDVAGNQPFSRCRRALTPDGKYVLIGHDHFDAGWVGSLPRFLGLLARSPFSKQLPRLDFSTPSKRDAMAALAELVEAGELTPVVARTFALSEIAEAIRYLESGEALGKIVITV
jgi:NADPH:quinone reductase-like Zn-dependent oxidoreductase